MARYWQQSMVKQAFGNSQPVGLHAVQTLFLQVWWRNFIQVGMGCVFGRFVRTLSFCFRCDQCEVDPRVDVPCAAPCAAVPFTSSAAHFIALPLHAVCAYFRPICTQPTAYHHHNNRLLSGHARCRPNILLLQTDTGFQVKRQGAHELSSTLKAGAVNLNSGGSGKCVRGM